MFHKIPSSSKMIPRVLAHNRIRTIALLVHDKKACFPRNLKSQLSIPRLLCFKSKEFYSEDAASSI